MLLKAGFRYEDLQFLSETETIVYLTIIAAINEVMEEDARRGN